MVHDRTRATHRVAPTCRAYRRVRCTSEHHVRPVARVVGAVREPPLQCPAASVMQTRQCAPTCARSFQGTVPPCPRTSENRVVQTIAHATSRPCRGDPVGRPAGLWRAGSRDDAVPSCTIAPGRRTASPLQFLREGVRGRRNMLPLRLQGGAPRRPYNLCVTQSDTLRSSVW
jgi:hypothetical protein